MLSGMRKHMTELKGKAKTRPGAKDEGNQGTINIPKAPASDSATASLLSSEVAASCPEEAWRKILSFLSLCEVAQAALAFSCGRVTRDSMGNAWDPHAILCGPWPEAIAGFRPFLAAAHATQLAEHVFCVAPRKLDDEVVKVLNQRCIPSVSVTAGSVKPRSVVFDKQPSALAFSNENALLSIAAGKEIKLIRRNDLKSCGHLTLSKGKGVGSMVFSPDNGTLVVVPMADSGALIPEIQLYSIEEKTKPVVTKLKTSRVANVDFLHAGSSRTGDQDLVAACDLELCKICPSTGHIIGTWKVHDDDRPFTACQAISSHEVITLADRSVEIWDLRTSDGLARSVKASQPVTALDASASRSSSLTFLGDINGALHRLDWRGTSALAPEWLWSPPKCLGSSLRSHKVMFERGRVCLITGPYLTMLTLDPIVVEFGWADATRLSACASGCGAWAFATNFCSVKGTRSTVVLVETEGEARQHQIQKDKELLETAERKAEPKAERKRDTNGKKPSSGKAQHGAKVSSGRCARTHPGSCRF